MIGKHWRRAEFKCKQCVSKELLLVTAHADSMDGAQCEEVTPRAETEPKNDRDSPGAPSKTGLTLPSLGWTLPPCRAACGDIRPGWAGLT